MLSGLHAVGDPNAGNARGVNCIPSVSSAASRTRSHARLNHYTRVQPRPKYHVLSGHMVSKIMFRHKRAIGAEYLPTLGGPVLTATANKEVLVAAGAVHRPQLLQLSGFGPRRLLEKHNIDVVADLPGVGANFQDQPSIIVPYNCTLIPILLVPG